MDDCLIIGGGVVGLSLAYELSSHSLRVHVIDRGQPGREASWAGAGILPPANIETAKHPWEKLRGLSHQLHPQWAEQLKDETGIDTGFRRCGGIYLARSRGEAALLGGLVGAFIEEGISLQRLVPADVCRLEPAFAEALDGGLIKAAYLVPDEAQLRNPHHLQALVAACQRRGVRISPEVEVTDFDIHAGRLQRVVSQRGDLHADQVCITSGAWTYGLLRKLGLPNGILPIRGQMVMFRCEQQPFQRILNEGPRYLVPREDGRVLVGSSEEEAGYDKQTTDTVLDELKQLAWSLVPALREAYVEGSWAGLRPGSFDGLPYLGKVPDIDNLYVAAGHYRSGLHTSPATAIVMSELLCGRPPRIDLQPFRIGRG